MAYTARKQADCKEFFDDEATLAKKIKKLAELVKKSKHFCVFTGAGISTAAGIADFRSGINTVLDTGAGKWAKEAAKKEGKEKDIKTAKKKTDSFKAIPTKAHMAIVGLITKKPKYLKYLISQNTDGLHRRSGVPLNNMSELHGNRTMEVCKKCGKEYMRDYRCRKSLRKQKTHDHFTGRYCTVPKCNGKLYDTIINFNESLHEIPLQRAQDNTDKCDLMLSLGSSLTVTPAADMPGEIGEKWEDEKDNNKTIEHNLCIVNLQKTPLDEQSSLRIFAKIDDVMIGLYKELGMEIPVWNLNRFLKVKIDKMKQRDDLKVCTISGVDIDGINASVFTSVKLRNNGQKLLKINSYGGGKAAAKFRPDEYVFNIPTKLEVKQEEKGNVDKDGDKDKNEEKKNENDEEKVESVVENVARDKGLVVELVFYGHYKEPNLLIQLNDFLTFVDDGKKTTELVLRLVFDLGLKKWIVKGKEEQMKDKDIGKLWKSYNDEDDED